MTISTAATPLSYAGNGATTAFPVTWRYIDKSHVVATLRASNGTETVKVLDTDYTLTSPSSSGTLTMITAPASGETLVITLEPPNTQESSFPLGGPFPSTTVEESFDEAAQRDAKIETMVDRALHVPKTDTLSGDDLEIPNETDRASKFLAFNSSGQPIASSGTSANLTPVSSFVNTLLDEADAAAFRNSIGIAWCGTATGTANALILTPAQAVTALVAGIEVIFKSSASGNSGATTIAVSGLTAKAAKSNGTAMVGGEIEASKWYRAIYDGADFQVQRIAPSVLLEMFTTKGDIQVATADQAVARKGVGSNGSVLMARSADTSGLAYVAALKKEIYGFTYANAAGDVTNDLDIAAGGAMDATGAYWMTGSALTKQSDAVWAVGTGAGGLDTGAVGNSDYYIWLIARSDTGVVDCLFSLSSTAPTMPTNYDFKRLIGWFKRTGGAIVLFHTYESEGGGLEMNWDVPTLDVNLANTLTTTRRTDAVKVPLNFSVLAHLNVLATDSVLASIWICCPDQTDAAPSTTVAPLQNLNKDNGDSQVAAQLFIRTSSAGLIAARSTLATVDLYAVSTMGFSWARRN